MNLELGASQRGEFKSSRLWKWASLPIGRAQGGMRGRGGRWEDSVQSLGKMKTEGIFPRGRLGESGGPRTHRYGEGWSQLLEQKKEEWLGVMRPPPTPRNLCLGPRLNGSPHGTALGHSHPVKGMQVAWGTGGTQSGLLYPSLEIFNARALLPPSRDVLRGTWGLEQDDRDGHRSQKDKRPEK